jgi:tRNA(Arg) A34 adenosine deaminase TadA
MQMYLLKTFKNIIMHLNKKVSLLVLISIIVCLLFLNQDWYRLFPKNNLKPSHIESLKEYGEKALDCLDIPVSAILLYQDEINGKGYNTILKDNNAGGHAEINAISNALKSIGHSEFSRMNRDSLLLITTYEPCLMCKGALINYRIKNISFIQKKSFWQHAKYSIQNLTYELHKRKSWQDTLQEYLFNKHPNYPKR